MADPEQETAAPSPWAPFGHGAFALLWSATLISNVGTWMHDVGAGWLMTSLTPSPAVVVLIQVATTAPVFLFALFAGALADRVDKKTLLLWVNGCMAVVAAALAVLVYWERMTPALLVLFTFALGTGAAFIAPAWQAVVPSLVPKAHLQPAIALNSMGINVSRAIGPALAGALIVALGMAAPFAVNAVSFLAIAGALLLWRPAPAERRSDLPPEPLFGAMVTGLRHASRNGPLKATIMRALGFFLFASAYWALMPLVARGVEGGGAQLYGLMMAAVGAAAVGGALLLPAMRKRLGADRLVASGAFLTALAMLVFASVSEPAAVVAAAALAGAGWIAVLTSLHVSAQTALPNWVRARGLAVLLMVFFGSMAAGSALWGQVASAGSVSLALAIAAAGQVVAIPLTWRWKLSQGEGLDLAPSLHWPAAPVFDDPETARDRGPVLIAIDYAIAEQDVPAFLDAIYAFRDQRFRDGAYEWGIYQSAEEPECWTEVFYVSSWAEHLRQHERVTEHDRTLQDAVHRFHKGEDRPRVRHLLAPEPGRRGAV